jgi:hypothetical protein
VRWFTDTNSSPSDSATIAWGDGTTSAGTVTAASGSNSAFVTGTDTYATDGVYTATVTITDGNETPSVSMMTIEIGTLPDAPTIASASFSGTSVTVGWSPASSGFTPTGYNLYGAIDSGTTLDWMEFDSVPASQTSDTINGLAPGTHDVFYVTAKDDFGESAPSANTSQVTTGTGASN